MFTVIFASCTTPQHEVKAGSCGRRAADCGGLFSTGLVHQEVSSMMQIKLPGYYCDCCSTCTLCCLSLVKGPTRDSDGRLVWLEIHMHGNCLVFLINRCVMFQLKLETVCVNNKRVILFFSVNTAEHFDLIFSRIIRNRICGE